MARLLLLVTTAFALCILAPSRAHADGLYFSESVGNSSIGSDLGAIYDGSVFAKLALGAQIENVGAEVFFAANALEARGAAAQHLRSGTLLRYGAEARYFVPVRRDVRLYMRGGLSSDYLDSGLSPMHGRGIEYGTGAMYSTKVRALGFLFWPAFFAGFGPKVSVSLWTDLGGHFARLRDERLRTLDVRTSNWSLGFTVGGGF